MIVASTTLNSYNTGLFYLVLRMAKSNSPTFTFEKALDELSSLVDHMEQGNISLEESLQCFEKGIHLTRDCQKSLQEAEQKVSILMEKNGRQQLDPFEPADE